MPVAADKRGLKRICMSCGTRFYDFNNRPVVCPSCETEFTGEEKVKGRRSRGSAANDEDVKVKKAEVEAVEETAKDETEEGEIETDNELVSLEALEEGDDVDEDDIPLDDDIGDLKDIEPDGLDEELEASLEEDKEEKDKD